MDTIFLIPLAVLLVLMALSVPISVSMMLSTLSYLIASHGDIGIICHKMMFNTYTSYVIIAVPLFIFMANVMNAGQVTDILFDFSKACIGKRRGALAYVNVLLSLIFAGMSGSAVADASGIGTIEISAMKRDGYDAPFSAAITAATATVGPVFPPSINLVIFATISGASVGAALLAGVIPAVLMCATLMLYVGFISVSRNYPRGSSYPFLEFLKITFKAIPALLTTVILLVSIYTGICTPTEGGAIASIYAILIAMFVYRNLSLKKLVEAVKISAIQSASIILLICAAQAFSYVIALSGLSNLIAEFLLSVTSNKYVFLAIVNIVLLILGMIMDTSPILYIVLPLMLTAIKAYDINLIHFSIIFTVNTMVGMCTPPYGILCFITSNISKTPLKSVFKEVLPMCLLLLVLLVLITYIPGISLWLPNIMLS